MKSRRSQPCPCGGSCSCHKKEKLFPLIFPLAFPIMLPGLFPGLFILAIALSPKPEVRHILVNGQDCIVKQVTDSCTSTGACSGHDEAVCPAKLSIH